MTTYGIDLGTTYSCIARVGEADRAEVVMNDAGQFTTPSVVYYVQGSEPVVGKAAKNAAPLHPERVVQLVKREMGTDWTTEIDGRTFTPSQVSSEILKYLKQSVEKTGEKVENVVITVPAYFGLAERNATERAGTDAGLNVMALVPEPVAAALHYESLTPLGERRTVLVFDLGGGTFDTTAIEVTADRIAVICTDGDHQLGGADWDELLSSYLLDRFQADHPDLDAAGDEQFRQLLAQKTEELKIDLSSSPTVTAVLFCGGVSASIEVSRKEFEEVTASKLASTMDITERMLKVAKERGVDHFDDVLLVGGSSRMPIVAETLLSRFGFESKLHDPDQAVAKGAALYAVHEDIKRRIAGGETVSLARAGSGLQLPSTITSVVPRAFGVKVVDSNDPSGTKEYVDHILHANDQLPINPPLRRYSTLHHNQTAITIEVWEQSGPEESPDLENNRRIGAGEITGMPPLPQGSPVTVEFKMDDIGRLSVHAEEETHQTQLDFEVKFDN